MDLRNMRPHSLESTMPTGQPFFPNHVDLSQALCRGLGPQGSLGLWLKTEWRWGSRRREDGEGP